MPINSMNLITIYLLQKTKAGDGIRCKEVISCLQMHTQNNEIYNSYQQAV